MSNKWYKLDNAAKIFPAIFKKNDTNSFRISALFVNSINKEALQLGLEEALKRFPTFCVKLKKGFFWYYFDHNSSKPIIYEEKSVVYDSVRLYKNNGFLFTLSYHGRRLSLEIFHALSDGTGGSEFFKCICYYYLENLGVDITNRGEIKTGEIEQNISESDDSFSLNYDKKVKRYGKEDKAFQLKGRSYVENWVGLVHSQMSVTNLKEVAHKYDATITEYIGAVILVTLFNLYFRGKKQKKTAKLFVPVNARKYFDSQSIRNFVLYVRTSAKLNEMDDLDIMGAVKIMKDTFEDELNKEKLLSRLVANVSFEKLFIVRIMPLFIKNIAMKIGYRILGPNSNTLSFSNLGIVSIPEEMRSYIERFEFSIGVSKTSPFNISSVSYGDIFLMTFSTRYVERNLIQGIMSTLSHDGVRVVLEVNNLEVE